MMNLVSRIMLMYQKNDYEIVKSKNDYALMLKSQYVKPYSKGVK